MRIADAGCDVVAGLETVPSPQVLGEIVSAVGADRVVFSLDLRDGCRCGIGPTWRQTSRSVRETRTDLEVCPHGCRLRHHAPIVLDLARVGGGAGTGTDELCREIASTYPHVEVIAGGGVSAQDDLKRLGACGVKGVLVASALHDGRIKPEYL